MGIKQLAATLASRAERTKKKERFKDGFSKSTLGKATIEETVMCRAKKKGKAL